MTRLLTLLLILSSLTGRAQEDKKVMEPINLLFEGMKKGDSAMAHNAFRPSPTFYTVYLDAKTSEPVLKVAVFADFLKAVGTPHKELWSEMIWSPKIEIDGNFAQVWVPYAFYAGKTFSHCGVDAFHLFKDVSSQWKIFHLADTRQKTGCIVPEKISNQFK